MTLNEYQEQAQRTSKRELGQYAHLINGVLGLAGETGECCDLVKKSLYQDGRDIGDALLDELGDVMWYVAEAAAAMDWSLEAVAVHNIEKLRHRYPEGFSAERSLNREESTEKAAENEDAGKDEPVYRVVKNVYVDRLEKVLNAAVQANYKLVCEFPNDTRTMFTLVLVKNGK